MKIRKKTKKKVMAGTIFVGVIVFLAALVYFSVRWFGIEFEEVPIATAVYQIFSPLKGTGADVILAYIRNGVLNALFLAVSIAFFFWFVSYFFFCYSLKMNVVLNLFGHKHSLECGKCITFLVKMVVVCLPVVALVFRIGTELEDIGFYQYLEEISNESFIYEEYYVSPKNVAITFPEKKRNLILIYMESMEVAFSSKEEGGDADENHIPNLTQIARDNVSFSNTDKLGGSFVCAGSTRTMDALLTSSAGVNFKMPITKNTADLYSNFLPGVVTMGDVLEQAGYNNYFVCGSDSEFAGRADYYTQHGSYELLDLDEITAALTIEEKDENKWGVNDNRLYDYVKMQLSEIAKGDAPFNFTMLTVDTHFPVGYVCELCEQKYSDQYTNVVECADRQIKDFVEWIQQQEWYENTTVVIMGDHKTMAKVYYETIDPEYDRRVFNCFINAAVEPAEEKNREFSTIDYFPTIVAAIGATIEGERLGLGVNLFSDQSTLIEIMGRETFDEQLGMYSKFYFDNFIVKK